jgi:hypothetical protein
MKLVKNLIFYLLVFGSLAASAQHVTIAPGNWNDGSIWNLGTPPTFASGSITVNHNVSVPAGYSVSIDQTTVNATLTIDAGGQLTIADGTGVDLAMAAGTSLLVNGELIRNNLSTLDQDVTSAAIFGAASTYRHRYQTTEGAPPLASWDVTSNFYMEGFANTSILDLTSSSWNQTFGNFIYNCTAQRSIVSFNGLITNIQGNLSFLSTGNNLTRLTDNEVNVTITVGGNLIIAGISRVNFSENGTGGVLNLGGNLNYTSTSSLGSILTNTGSFTINITGNFIMNATGGRIFMAGSLGSTGTSTLNLNQNFTLTAGTITEAGTGTANGNIRFIGTGTFTFVNSGSILNLIHWYIAPTIILDLGVYPIASGTGSVLKVDAATLICGSLEATGAIRNSTALGNIRTPVATRSYVAGSTFIYRSSNAQFMGDGQPTGSTITTIVDNNNGVTLYQGSTAILTINGTLQLETGMLFIGARTLSLTGTINYNAGTFGGNASSVLNIGGTTGGSIGTLTFDSSNNILGTLTLNRTGLGASVDVNSVLVINSQLNLTNGILNNTSGLTAGNGCVVTRYPTAQLLQNRLTHGAGDLYSVVYRTASTTGTFISFDTELELPSDVDATALSNLTINTAQVADVVQLTQDITVNGNVNLNRGNLAANTFAIIMQGSNWFDNSGNFTSGTGVVIFNNITTVAGTSTPLLGNIQLTTGSSLICGKSFNISGDIDFQSGSTFDPATYTINLTGSVLQTISANGATFFNIAVAKSGGSDIALTSILKLQSILRFNTPSTGCDFQSNGFLTLISTSDAAGTATVPNTAQIYRLTSSNTVTGDVIVQRYMSGEGRIYRYLSSPVSNATVASWKDDFPITGSFTDPTTGPGNCGRPLGTNPSLYYYNETTAGTADVGYVAYPSSGLASSNPLEVGRGYATFIRECTNPTVVDVTGPVNQGTFTYNVTYTNTGDASADGYNLVGNPYPCTVDWDAGWTKTRISNVIAIRDNGNGVVLYWDGTTGDIPNGEIAVGQGFWVRATGASPLLRITENAKVISPDQSGEFFRKATPTDYLTLSLTDGAIRDKAYLKVRSVSKNTLDAWDAPKMNNDIFDLYTISDDNIPLAINSLNNITCSSSFALGIKDMEKKTYTLSMDDVVGVFSQYSFTLIDHYTNRAVQFTAPYQFVVDDNPLSASAERFVLQVNPKIAAAPVSLTYNTTLCKPENTVVIVKSTVSQVEYKLFDANGQLITKVNGSGADIPLDIISQYLSKSSNTFVIKSYSTCGTVYDSKDIQIAIEQSPEFSTAGSNICGSGRGLLSTIDVPDGYTVNWFATEESDDLIGTGLNFETPSLNKTATYYASVVSANGCQSPRMSVMANVINVETPIITQQGSNVLTVNTPGDIQWYYNNEVITGAINTSIVADKAGTYAARLTENGCTATGNYEFLVTGIEDQFGSNSLFYPNPVERYLFLRDQTLNVDHISFIDNLGKVKTANAIRNADVIQFDLENFSSGVYYIQILKDGKLLNHKIIKR